MENSFQLFPATSAVEGSTFTWRHVSSIRFSSIFRVIYIFILSVLLDLITAPHFVPLFHSSVFVFVDEHCCPDPSQGRVSVGLGDSCCGGVPYSMSGGQVCCGGSLHDGYGVRCCGGQVVDESLVCCGDAERGEVHTYTPGE